MDKTEKTLAWGFLITIIAVVVVMTVDGLLAGVERSYQ